MDKEAEVRGFVDAYSDVLPPDVLTEVRHYLEHGEYEMAFEGLVLELIQHGATPSAFSSSKWLEVAEDLGLRSESVFVGDFWSRLVAWANSREAT